MTRSVLIFRLNGDAYGVDTDCVREIVQLPELARLFGAPEYVAGMFNLRGATVPVIDLNGRFGFERRRFRLSDS
ncbi:MAG: chemotaxis protein CheW, partial [Candidatus Poribacteria bacterium]|nr:chemotaxis protein CheW [Candidatus Poribacteria bacterium]